MSPCLDPEAQKCGPGSFGTLIKGLPGHLARRGWWWVGRFIPDYGGNGTLGLGWASGFPITEPSLLTSVASCHLRGDKPHHTMHILDTTLATEAMLSEGPALGHLAPSPPTRGLWPGAGGKGRLLVLGGPDPLNLGEGREVCTPLQPRCMPWAEGSGVGSASWGALETPMEEGGEQLALPVSAGSGWG